MSGAAAPRQRSGGKVKTRLPRIGLALAGGGPLGGINEIGALHLEAWLAAASAT